MKKRGTRCGVHQQTVIQTVRQIDRQMDGEIKIWRKAESIPIFMIGTDKGLHSRLERRDVLQQHIRAEWNTRSKMPHIKSLIRTIHHAEVHIDTKPDRGTHRHAPT